MVTIEGDHGSRSVFCSPQCVVEFRVRQPAEAIDYLPAPRCNWRYAV
jgi:hypothetical protein